MNLRLDQDAAIAADHPSLAPVTTPSPGSTTQSTPNPVTAERRVDLWPLASLVPYIRRYRWRALCALGALIVAAATTLIVPIAIRRMIDFGFTARGVALIDSYFLVMIGVAAARAVACALR
jgi:ATP-binding cassette subfamily B protein